MTEFNQFKQLEEITKLQLSNTKIEINSLCSGKTPYFNKLSFIDLLLESNLNDKDICKDWISWKINTYNLIISKGLESCLVLLRKIEVSELLNLKSVF